jgi:uncharacterized protein (DUF1684 family)
MRILLLSLLMAGPAVAEPFYVGGQVGQAYVDSIYGDASALAYGGLVGYQLNPHIALEASYQDLSGGHTVDLDAIASQPLPYNLEVYGKVGVSFLGIDQAVQVGRHHKSPPFDYSQDCINYGGGIGYSWQRFRGRLGIEWISADGLSILRVSTFSLAVKF